MYVNILTVQVLAVINILYMIPTTDGGNANFPALPSQ